MKRRNVEVGKMRRPMKRNKITEGIYGSTLLYLKFLVLWVLVILADFILEFRFEFLWPFYLLLRSVYDSFKYQGLAFSLFFVCVALTSDMLCFFFIPVHWLFFAASTYVWVQYVWHTDRGICAPTIILWVLFVYLEAAVRLRDVKHMPGHLDLCRPFAAHCIGYPVVTLGFGFKSYIGYRMRQRKQRDVAKENEFYLQLMQQALPVDTTSAAEVQQQPESTGTVAVTSVTASPQNASNGKIHQPNRQSHERNGHIMNGVTTVPNGVAGHAKSHRKSLEKSKEHSEHEHRHADRQRVSHPHSNGTVVGAGAATDEASSPSEQPAEPRQSAAAAAAAAAAARRREKKEQDREREAAEYLQRLETDAKRLRADLQSSRASEQELRLQVASLTTSDKVARGELSAMQRELEEMQNKLQRELSCRTSDRQTISSLERRLAEERRVRANCESQLAQERKSRKAEEVRAAQAAAAAAAAAAAQSSRTECTEQCKARRRELESEIGELRSTKHWAEERCAVLERENSALAEQLRDTEILMSALATMQEKNAHLENSLSAETRIKLDLFSALGEAKRQLEIRESTNRAQEKEIDELKSKIAQVLAVMPNDAFVGGPPPTNSTSRVRLSAAAVAPSPPDSPPGSTLDPNATAYTPKGSLVASTEA